MGEKAIEKTGIMVKKKVVKKMVKNFVEKTV